MTNERRFPPPWGIEEQPAPGFRVHDANGGTVCWIYAREDPDAVARGEAMSMADAYRLAVNIARLPDLLRTDKS